MTTGIAGNVGPRDDDKRRQGSEGHAMTSGNAEIVAAAR